MNMAITCLYAMLLLDVNLDLIFEHNAISYIDLADITYISLVISIYLAVDDFRKRINDFQIVQKLTD